MPTVETIAKTDAGLAAVLRLSVMRLRRRLTNERHPDNTLSLGQMAVLVALFPDRETTLGDLAARERVQPPSMTRTVNCLEEGGYITRRASETDRRQVLVAITPKGAAVVKNDRVRRDAWLNGHLARLSQVEIDILRKAAPILDKLADAE
jgi:DNA-binding MarR family transcriptional regulator